MIKTIFIFLLFIIGCSFANAQGLGKIKISGKILSSDGSSVLNSSVRVSQKGTQALLQFYQTGAKNAFSFYSTPITDDSISITILHPDYKNAIYSYTINEIKSADTLALILQKKAFTLDTVQVKTAKWKNGDTTFYNKEAYAIGGEVKLKDIIARIPEFSIDLSGRLLYKHRLVDKIKIGGEELFANDTELLLRSFPIHVLENIEVLENQNENKVLAGLRDERKIIVNLSIKDKKVKISFGDANMVIGTNERYAVSPVLFALRRDFNLGYISNYNNTGDGAAATYSNSYQAINSRFAYNKSINSVAINTISQFPISYFLKNRFMEQKFTFGFPSSKQMKHNIEFGLITDRQSQTTSNETTLLLNTAIGNRSELSTTINNPRILSFTTNSVLNKNEKQSFAVGLTLVKDFGRYSNNNIYSSAFEDRAQQDLSSSLLSFVPELVYTRRISKAKAVEFKAKFVKEEFTQIANGNAAIAKALLGAAVTNFNTLKINLKNQSSTLDLSSTYFFPIGAKKFSTSTSFVHTSGVTTPLATFGELGQQSADSVVDFLSEIGEYKSTTLSQQIGLPVKIANLKITLVAKAGLQTVIVNDKVLSKKFTNFISDLQLKQISNLPKMNIETTLGFSNRPTELSAVYNSILPRSLSSFATGYSKAISFKQLDLSNSILFNRKSIFKDFSFLSFAGVRFNNVLYKSSLSRFIVVSSINTIEKPTINYTLIPGYSHFFKKIKTYLTIDFTQSYSGQLYGEEDNLKNSFFISTKTEVSLSRRVTRVYNASLKYVDESQQFKLRQMGSAVKLSSLKSYGLELNQDIRLNKRISFKTQSRYLSISSPSIKTRDLLITDLSSNIALGKSKWSLILELRNLFNTSSIVKFTESTTQKSISTIALQPRFLLAKFVFQF